MDDQHLVEILSLVAHLRGVDFRDYRPDTLRRRAETRMRATGCADLTEYRVRLLGEPTEVDRLLEALVVPVTQFFRDEWIFRQMAERVLPGLVARKRQVHAWVAGVATGEEAYTLALLLAEACARDRGNGFEVIASDLDNRSLEVARAGIYPQEALASVPPHLHSRYFRPEGSGIRVADAIRDRVHFAQHDLVGTRLAPREAIVAHFDLVLCRNVLLYFDPSLRAKAVARLAAVLEPGGALMVGSSETLPPESERDFAAYPGVSAGSAIFVRREN